LSRILNLIAAPHRLYDDRLEVFIGATLLMTLARGRAATTGKHAHVVDYRFLAALAEHEIAERDRRRLARHLAEAQLLPGKTLDSFDFDAVPMISKAHVMAICAGDIWIDKGANLILIGGLGGGKTHLSESTPPHASPRRVPRV